MSPLIEGAILARFSPAPHLILALRVHDSSKTGNKTPSGSSIFFLLKCSNKTFKPTPEFLLTIEVGIAGDVRKCLWKTVKCRFRCGLWLISAILLRSSESFCLAIFSHNGCTCIQCATSSTLWKSIYKCICLRSTQQPCNTGGNSVRKYHDAWKANCSTPGGPFLSRQNSVKKLWFFFWRPRALIWGVAGADNILAVFKHYIGFFRWCSELKLFRHIFMYSDIFRYF